MEWREVVGFEGLYEVSANGKVRSMDRVVPHPKSGALKLSGKMLTLIDNGRGYLQVNLSRGGKSYCKRVNRLVAIAFIENTENLPEVAHLDETRDNNHYTNLKWVTSKQNSNFPKLKQRLSEANKNGKLSKVVVQTDLEGNKIKSWVSAAECGRNGFNQVLVSSCCRGEKEKYKNFKWYYE